MQRPWILLAFVAITAGCAPSEETSSIVHFEMPDATVLSAEDVASYGDLTAEADAAYGKDDPAEEGHAHAVSQVAATAAEIVADLGGSEHSRDAYYWLLRAAILQEDREGMGEILGILRERWQEDEEFWESEILQLYGIRTIPTTILVDRDGRVVGVDLEGDALELKLQELL